MSHADTVIARSRLLPSVNTSYGQTFLENQPGLRAGSLVAQTSEKQLLYLPVRDPADPLRFRRGKLPV